MYKPTFARGRCKNLWGTMWSGWRRGRLSKQTLKIWKCNGAGLWPDLHVTSAHHISGFSAHSRVVSSSFFIWTHRYTHTRVYIYICILIYSSAYLVFSYVYVCLRRQPPTITTISSQWRVCVRIGCTTIPWGSTEDLFAFADDIHAQKAVSKRRKYTYVYMYIHHGDINTVRITQWTWTWFTE